MSIFSAQLNSSKTISNAFILSIIWTLSISIGIIFLGAGILKATKPFYFVKQIAAYNILPWHTSHVVLAWGLITTECALGASLIIGYRLRASLIFTLCLLCVFEMILGWAWIHGATFDCGCFGQLVIDSEWIKSLLQRTPKQAFIEDAVLIIGVFIMLLLIRNQAMASLKDRWKAIIVSVFTVIGFGLPLFFGFPALGTSTEKQAAKVASNFQTVKISGTNIDLKQGEHLIALIDTGCEHCQASVPIFNSYLTTKNIPTFIALCSNEEWKRKFFADRYKSKFVIGEISQSDFDGLLQGGDTPRIVYLRSGKVIKVWDLNPPTIEELQKLHVAR